VTGSEPIGSGELTGVWCVASVGSMEAGDVVATVEFTADGRVQGNAGVNTFSGPYTVVGDEIEFGPLISTLMAGAEPASEVERRLFAVLDGSRPFAIDGDVLTLGSGDAAAVLRPQSAPSEEPDELVVVSGSVTYRERMALPPDAVLVVAVHDVTTTEESTPIAEVSIAVTHQVPIAYAVAIEREMMQLDHRYSLSAQISVDDTVLFETPGELDVFAVPAAQTIDVLLSRA
jgi:uncharacterized lipoprotein YbaY